MGQAQNEILEEIGCMIGVDVYFCIEVIDGTSLTNNKDDGNAVPGENWGLELTSRDRRNSDKSVGLPVKFVKYSRVTGKIDTINGKRVFYYVKLSRKGINGDGVLLRIRK